MFVSETTTNKYVVQQQSLFKYIKISYLFIHFEILLKLVKLIIYESVMAITLVLALKFVTQVSFQIRKQSINSPRLKREIRAIIIV